MYKLTIRRQWFLFVGSLLLCLGLVIFLPSHSPDKVVKLPLILVLLGELIMALGMSFLCYHNAPLPQKVKAAATFLAVTTGIGTIGNLTSQVNQPLPGTDVLISWIQLGIMNIGGFISTFALYEIQAIAGAEPIKESPSDIVRTVKPRPSVSATRLPALAEPLNVNQSPSTAIPTNTPTTSSQTVAKPQAPAAEPVSASVSASAPTPQDGVPAIPDIPLDKQGQDKASKRAASITNQRIQVQGKRNTSTFTKLQALSATGRALTSPAGSGQESDGLKSILDRLEDQVESTQGPETSQSAASKPKVQEAPAPPQPAATQPAAQVTPQVQVPAQPAAPPAPAAKSSIASRLVGVVTKNKMPAANDPLKSASPTAKTANNSGGSFPSANTSSTSTSATGFAPPTEKQSGGSFPGGPSSTGEMSSQATQAPTPTSSGTSHTRIESNRSEMGFQRTKQGFWKPPVEETPAAETPPQAPQAEAAAAAPSQPDTSESYNQAFSPSAEPEAPSRFAPEPAHAEVGTQAEAATSSSGEAIQELALHDTPKNTIFEVGVDEEMDEIFSKLVGPEAQRNVQHFAEFEEEAAASESPAEEVASVAYQEQQPSEEVWAHEDRVEYQGEPAAPEPAGDFAPRGASLLGDSVSSEIDDIFSALAPAEAQREVQHVFEPEAEVAVTGEPEEETQAFTGFAEDVAGPGQQAAPAEQEGVFGSGLSEEIDDIFSHLAPAEAQMNVSDRAQAREAAAPVEEEAEAEMSFAPPPEAIPDAIAEAEAPQFIEEEELAAVEEELEEYEDYEDMPVVNPVTKNIEVKEFGRLSSKSAAAKTQQNTAGTMKTIGKLLIDVQAIENIIKSGESGTVGSGLASARVISTTRGEGIKALLGRIDEFQGVSGCLIVGHDGLVIASTVSGTMDKDALGALSSALLNTSNLATLKLEIGKLKQMVLLTEYEYDSAMRQITTVLTDVEVGVLAVFLETQQLDRLDGLLAQIHTTIHG